MSIYTVWYVIFAGVLFCVLAIFFKYIFFAVRIKLSLKVMYNFVRNGSHINICDIVITVIFA